MIGSIPQIVNAVQNELREGRGNGACQIKAPVNTTVGAHGQVDSLAMQARAMGLEVDVMTSGGWFAKSHLITVRGAVVDVSIWLRALQRVTTS